MDFAFSTRICNWPCRPTRQTEESVCERLLHDVDSGGVVVHVLPADMDDGAYLPLVQSSWVWPLLKQKHFAVGAAAVVVASLPADLVFETPMLVRNVLL